MTDEPLALRAPAKLNLSLSVVGRRPDGLHLLRSTFVLLELADRLVLHAAVEEDAAGLELRAAAGEPVPAAAAENLAWRGLEAALGPAPRARLVLEKAIPAAAGLGGGSSDAAAAWRLGRARAGAAQGAERNELEALARLGADVPFFAATTPRAFVAGIGERIEPRRPEPGEVLLVLPPFRLSTAAVFAALRPTDWSATPGAGEMSDAEPGRNDLLAAAVRLRPELAELQRRVAMVAGREPRLSGSGPTLFLVDPDAERLDAVARRIAEEATELRMLRTRLAQRAASIEPVQHEEGTRA